MRDYLEETNVQLGASYDVAKQSTESYDKGLEAAAKFMNAEADEIGMLHPLRSTLRHTSLPSQQSFHPNFADSFLMTSSDRPLNNPTLHQSLPNPLLPSLLRNHHLLHRPRSQHLSLGPSRQNPKRKDHLVDSTQRLSAPYTRKSPAAVIREDEAGGLHAYEQCARQYP